MGRKKKKAKPLEKTGFPLDNGKKEGTGAHSSNETQDQSGASVQRASDQCRSSCPESQTDVRDKVQMGTERTSIGEEEQPGDKGGCVSSSQLAEDPTNDWPSLSRPKSASEKLSSERCARLIKESEHSAHTQRRGVTIRSNIYGENIQIGDNNVVICDSSSDLAQRVDDGKTDPTSNLEKAGARPKSYANVTNSVVGKNVNIHYHISNEQPDKQSALTDRKRREDFDKFMKLTSDFKCGHFILVVGKVGSGKQLNALGYVPWTAVLDFDPDSRQGGLLSFVEGFLEKKRSLHITTLQDKCTFTDTNTCWMLIKGSTDRPDTLVDTRFDKWKVNAKQNLNYLMKQLELFKQGSTEYTILVIWPDDKEEIRYLNFVLAKFEERLNPSILLVYEGECPLDFSSDLYFDIKMLKLSLTEVCRGIRSKYEHNDETEEIILKLPTFDRTNNPGIDECELQALNEELEVLYLGNATGIQYSVKELQEEEENFFRGGTLPWAWWYHVGSGHANAERDIKDKIVHCIKQDYLDECKSGCVTLYHSPGSGGTTLAQSLLWELRKDVPCVQVKHRNSQPQTGLVEKIQLLSDKTHLPILILMDGEEEQKVEHLQRTLRCCFVILYVKRCLTEPEKKHTVFWLKPYISKKEVSFVGKKFLDQCQHLKKSEKQHKAVDQLIKEIQKGQEHSIFEFGLVVHSYEYKGIQMYVESFLQLREIKGKNLHPWQRALVMLSLAHFYGQTSVPCHLFSTMIHPRLGSSVLLFEDFPEQMKEFIVRDPHERRGNVVRMSHYYIAKEIIDQILLWHQGKTDCSKRKILPTISQMAKNALAPYVVDFIKIAGEVSKNVASDAIMKVLIRTIISRDNTAVGENEVAQTTKTKKPLLSPILEDVSSTPPFTERFSVIQTLIASFPTEPQFHAHLGRLYTICRPEKEEEAEKSFQNALDICNSEIKSMLPDEIPFNMRLTLMHVYHMYGNMFSTRISKYTGRHIQDMPRIQVDPSNKDEICEKLLQLSRQSCRYFNECREITPPGCEKSVGYIAEINVRLMFCDFVSRHKCTKISIHDFMSQDTSEIGEFVGDSFEKLDELFIDCFSSIEPEKMDQTVWNSQKWFVHLFGVTALPGYLVNRVINTVDTSRRKIVMLKMLYSDHKSLGVLDLVSKSEHVKTIVKEYEKIFAEIDQNDQRIKMSKRDIDIDHREWLFAIRHPKFPESYSIEKVLLRVQTWFDSFRTPTARFYLFVLKTLLGFGSSGSDGNTQILIDAQQLKEDLVQQSKYMAKPKYPREWLGPNGMGIHRMTPGKRFFGQIVDQQSCMPCADLKLEIMKGTICPPNDKPAVGYISLDLGPSNKVPVKIFYVPVRTNMKGEMNQGARVEFVIGFSMSHGYEAFNVQKIGRAICGTCKRLTEYRSCDCEIQCKCGSFIRTKRNGTPRKE